MKKENYKQFYEQCTNGLKARPFVIKTITLADKLLAWCFAFAYPFFLGIILFSRPFSLLFTANKVGLPALCFIAVTLLRWLIKRPRPYEEAGAGIESLTKKSGIGNSMPSRHVASAFVISLIILPECLWMGITALIAATLLAFLRFLEGVHYPSDLIAGALLGVAFGAIGLFF
jgi:membrane-associated phospholipid phosphatase